jgi:ABC-type cobalt transport system substrate-binding protein
MKTKHILKMSCGVTVEAEFDEETAAFKCEWSPSPPFSERLIEKIRREYEPWRNEIFENFAERTGKKVLLFTL